MTSPYSVEVTSVVEIPTTVTVMDNTVTQIDVVELGVIGPQGVQGVQGVPGPTGPAGAVASVTAGDATITVGGTAANPTLTVTNYTVNAASSAYASVAGGVLSTGLIGTITDAQLTSGVTITGVADKILKTSSTGTIDADIDAGSSSSTTNKIQFRKDSGYNWFSNNPTLASGEIGIATDDSTFKIGDGTTAWNSLLYATDGSKLQNTIDGTKVVSTQLSYRKYPTSSYFYAPGMPVSTGAVSPTAQRQWFVPFYVNATTTFTKLGLYNYNALATGVVRLGIYSSTANDQPGNLLLDAGTVSVATAATALSITISQSLAPGLYWLSSCLQVAATGSCCKGYTLSSQFAPFVYVSSISLSTGAGTYYRDSVAGAFSNPAVLTGITASANVPAVVLGL